ncbi:MAG: translation initiation factor IF-2 [Desulfobulbaceae bacterium]|nr:translation initiation factor IF-2 [Desulfobulbaceae bacterium]
MKVRVYELAKEVGMDSKVLAAKLIELGYDVKSYNSGLDESVAEDIRKRLTSTHTEIQEKRIQSTSGGTTVIRRRAKAVPNLDLQAVEQAYAEAEAQAPAAPEVVPEPEPAPVAPAHAEEQSVAPSEKGAGSEESIVAPSPEVSETDVVLPEVAVDSSPATMAAEDVETADESEALRSVDEEDDSSPSPTPADNSRKGFARVIKRAAIQIPVEAPKSAAPRRPATPVRPATSVRPKKAMGADPMATNKPSTTGGSDDAAGHKGKRFVKFTHSADADVRAKKGGVKKKGGYTDIDIEDVAMAGGGRFAASLKIGRGGRGGGKKAKGDAGQGAGETKAIKKRIIVHETITIGDLAHRMGVKVNELIAKLMRLGVMATVNQSLDLETATLVASDFGYEVELALTDEISIINLEEEESGGEMLPRPPVVTVMGHVDHGKTSILDAIRNTDVAAGEAGGITQHIGAHYVRSSAGDVVFLDTPGHAAFTEMRSRGAQVTDVVVLVVAADDGVMDQTKEAINHAKAAQVPIVVAINKIDKQNADPMRVKRELSEFALVPEEWGGDTIFCEVSAKKNLGIDSLLEQILLQAEILELRADPKRKARGRVVEAHLHKGRGPVATVLVQQGTLRTGDAFVIGDHYGKVRMLFDDKGKRIDEAGPAMPVEIQGLSGVPMSGDEFIVLADEKMAKNLSNERQMKSRELQLGKASKVSLDNLFDKLKEGDMKELFVLIRADVQGTLEAFGQAITNLGTEQIRVRVLHEGTGTITDSDVLLAAASNAIIIGFNVRPSNKVQEFAKNENVDIRFYDVIYHALDDIRLAMVGMLDPTFVERVLGHLEVRETFSVPKIGTIAGCYVTDGKIERNAKIRLIREGVVVFTGTLASLRRFKDDMKEVVTGRECGVGIENYNDIKIGDTLEAYFMDEVAGKL